MAQSDQFISKGRLDALADGVFAFAMTLLVIKVELPDDFAPVSGAELLAELGRLADTFVTYIITFLILALFWFGRAGTREEPEKASGSYAWAVVAHLFFVTVMPFSMVVAASYDFLPAVALYAANLILLAATAILIIRVVERDTGRRVVRDARFELAVLIVSALLSVAIAAFDPGSGWLLIF
jgi:uncharacterized membrane protein